MNSNSQGSPMNYQLAGLAALSAMAAQGRGKKKLIIPGQGRSQQLVKRYKVGRNEPCPCGSGKKFKKCHGGTTARHSRPTSLRPRERPMLEDAQAPTGLTVTEAPAALQATAQAMLRAKIPERLIWAYLETGIFITEDNRSRQPEEKLQQWDAALAAYDNASPEDRRILAVPAGG